MKPLSSSEFLRLVWPSALLTHETLELRTIRRSDGRVHREFATSIDDFLSRAENYKEREVYFSVATRFREDGTKNGCYRINALWCDLDGKTLEECDFKLQPNILVSSGGGVHAYWLLKHPILVTDERRDLIENRTRWLAQKFKGDPNTCDVSRILRVPGGNFFNHKYKPAREVKAFNHLYEGRYQLQDFGEIEKPEIDPYEILPRRVIEDIPDMLRDRLAEVGGGRFNDASRQDASDITALLKCGIHPSDVYSTFAASQRGKDAQQRKAGHFHDYMQRTIRSSLSCLGKSLRDYGKKKVEATQESGKDGSNTIRINFSKQRNTQSHEGIHFTHASEIETQKTRWLWQDYLPAEKITLLAGDPGKGKSTIAIDLVAKISKGTALPSGGRSIVGNCLIASAEDAPEDTITPRLIAAEANLKRVVVLRQVMIDGELHYFSLPRDLNRLRELIQNMGIRLVIIDPLNAFLAHGTDSYKDQDIRSVLAPLEDLAEETGAAILIVAHLNKKEDSSTLYRVGGSVGLTGAARSVLMVSDTGKKNVKALFSVKSNLGRRPTALSYDTQPFKKTRSSPDEWKGEDTIHSSRIRWLGAIEFDPSNTSAVSADKSESEAEDFLRQVLSEGEIDSEEIFREARKAGISRGAVNSVKTQISIKAKRGRNGSWFWSLPS